MLKKASKIFLILLITFALFSFWMSPRLGGIIPLGKDKIDSAIFHLAFDTIQTGEHELLYKNNSDQKHLINLRSTFNLDSIIKDSKTDFEKIVKIQNWVQSRWEHDGSNAPKTYDAIAILTAAEKGERFRCVEYSFVTGQCLASLGFTVRGLGLMTKDISEVKSGGGHVVNEVYLQDLQKWVMIDPQFALIPVYEGVPLSAVELQECIANKMDFEILNPNNTTTKEKYEQWVGPYLYYFSTTLTGERVSIKDRILGNKKQLTLYALDAEQPTYFQKIFRLNTSYYTHSMKSFYPIVE